MLAQIGYFDILKRVTGKVFSIITVILVLSGSVWGASQDFKGTINGNTITVGTGTVTITAGKTITATQNTSLDDTIALSKKANLETANSFTNIGPMTTIAESWIGPSSTTGVYFKDGGVGIGTTPTTKLEVSNGVGPVTQLIDSKGTALAYIRTANSTTGTTFGNEGATGAQVAVLGIPYAGIINQTGTYPLQLATDNTARVTIDSGGNVGIGTTTIPSMLTVAGLINMKNYTVATLPAGTRGDIAYVTDALAPTFLAAIVGGGAVVSPVFFNGAAWVGF